MASTTRKTTRKSTRSAGKTAAKVASRKGQIRSERVVEAGPRGFRFGPTWCKAVKSKTGIAAHPTYLPKLKAHAKELGVSAAGKQEDILERVSAALPKNSTRAAA
jgi:hypothetical protein